jgi:hypothetical protein
MRRIATVMVSAKMPRVVAFALNSSGGPRVSGRKKSQVLTLSLRLFSDRSPPAKKAMGNFVFA